MNAYEQAKLGEALQNYYKASKGNEIAFDLFIHRHFVKGVADTLFNGYKMGIRPDMAFAIWCNTNIPDLPDDTAADYFDRYLGLLLFKVQKLNHPDLDEPSTILSYPTGAPDPKNMLQYKDFTETAKELAVGVMECINRSPQWQTA